METALIVAVIGFVGAILAAIITVRSGSQDQKLDRIEINVNSRLDRLLTQANLDNAELDRLRPLSPPPVLPPKPYGRRHDDDPTGKPTP